VTDPPRVTLEVDADVAERVERKGLDREALARRVDLYLGPLVSIDRRDGEAKAVKLGPRHDDAL